MLNYDDAIKLITSKNNFYIDLGLDRISEVLKKLGSPEDRLKFIHVAGTNGKGSVCTMLESILREAGYKTGLYTSPHITDYTERIKVNGEAISKEDFAELVDKIVSQGIHLTEFEILTVMMFMYFAREKVDVVVLETGLGGRLDATNVIKNNLCAIITQIDLDHTDRLGNTKEKIAYEKAGIIKPACPVITGMEYDAIKDRAKKLKSEYIYFPSKDVPEKFIDALSLKGLHQIDNLALVLCTINTLFPNITDDIIIEGLKKVKNPCRFEYIKGKNLIIDGAHNPNGIKALRSNLDYYFPNQKRRFIFGCLKRKDYKQMMDILFRPEDEIYINEFDYPGACSYSELSSACKYTTRQYHNDLQLTPDRLNVVCGSFYMIGGMKSKNLI